MTRISSRSLPAFAASLLALALAGCSAGPRPTVADAPPPAAATGWAGREEVGRAIDLLNKGDENAARKLLGQVVKRQPNDPIAADLLGQIDGDPVTLLGSASYAYTVREGDTLSALAGRFLGNPTLFYALGRYNQLSFPITLAPGQTLRIPGEPKPAAKPTRPAPAERPRPPVAASKPATPAPAVPKPAAADPARAARLRAAALEQLNRGQVNRAIGLLRQAEQAAPGNPLIRRDLARALRIRRAVQAPR